MTTPTAPAPAALTPKERALHVMQDWLDRPHLTGTDSLRDAYAAAISQAEKAAMDAALELACLAIGREFSTMLHEGLPMNDAGYVKWGAIQARLNDAIRALKP